MSRQHTLIERFAGAFALVALALVVSGTKACREDYELGSQVAGTTTPTPTPDGGTGDDGGDDDVISGTPTPTPAPTLTPTATPDDGTGDDDGGDDEGDSPDAGIDPPAEEANSSQTNPGVPGGGSLSSSDANELIQELSLLGDGATGSPVVGQGNWLGAAESTTSGSAVGVKGVWADSDGDGYSDWLEEREGSDPRDARITPTAITSTDLDGRVRALDADFDGISDAEEERLGTSMTSMDTDMDGRPDGAEVASGSNPKVADSYPDRDNDGLSDEYELARGTNPDLLDTDNDGLRDDLELVVGSDPYKSDSDDDGISDGKEFELGSDPTVAE